MTYDKKKVDDLVHEHWDEYTREVLKTHDVDENEISKCEFHYISSGIHFYKHGYEDAVRDMEVKSSRKS